jgi:hypothetical protein
MPFIYNNYCYPSLADAAAAESSGPPQAVNNGVSLSLPYTPNNATSVYLNFRYKSFTSTTVNDSAMVKTYNTCAPIGPMVNQSGLSLVDVMTVSWLVVGVWVVAWGVKLFIKRVFV